MRRIRSALVATGSVLALVPVTAVTTSPATAASTASTAASPVSQAPAASAPASRGGRVVLAWHRTALRTTYVDAAQPVPVGTLYVAFTSLAMDRAVRAARRHPDTSAPAAVAAAAHHVLRANFPDFRAALRAQLRTSLERVPDGRAERRGVRIGREMGAVTVRSRVGDGRDDASITYDLDPGPGVWEEPATGMLAPWLGYVRPLVPIRPVRLDGPDDITSAAYAADFAAVKRFGSATPVRPFRHGIANFFNSNSMILYTDALARTLVRHPIGLARTSHLFAAATSAMANAVIQAWRLKREVGFWRPSEAIVKAADDGNPATTPDPSWLPAAPNPAYADYPSGHGALTSAFAETTRMLLGNRVPLELRSLNTGTTRRYATLRAVERHALRSRIWCGIHFRDAMEDAYDLGHRTAHRVLARMK